MRNMKKATGRGDDGMKPYLELIQNFPLRPLKTEGQYTRAITISESLLDRFDLLTEGERDYFELLDHLIGVYEDREFAEDNLDSEPRELILSLMAANHLHQADLLPDFGSRSRVSEFLSGKRDLSMAQIQTLCQRFKLRPEVLIAKKAGGV